MTLSKVEIQQMLREMNVKFQADETIEALKQRLQQENHRLWLKSVSADRTPAGRTEKKRVLRKRKSKAPDPDARTLSPRATAKPEASARPITNTPPNHPRKSEHAHRPLQVEKPAPGQPWKSAADGTEPFNRKKNVFAAVLRRARLCCERCGIQSGQKDEAAALAPYHILPLSQGGEHSIKNVAALCPACLDAMQDDPDSKSIKVLKRKTRSKLYDSLQVVHKKTGRRRRPFSRKGFGKK